MSTQSEMERLMTVKEVEAATGLKRLALSIREKEGRFPPSIKLDSGHRRYVQSEVSQWISSQIENARKGA